MSDVAIDLTPTHAPQRADAPEARVQRVGACALGLAYAGREDDECLAELLGMAGGSRVALEDAVARLPELGVVEEAITARARRLLWRAAKRLPAHGSQGRARVGLTGSPRAR